MPLHALVEQSAQLAAELYSVIAVPRFDDTERIRVSDIACSMSLEHWDATRSLLASGLLPSGLVVHRAQFEALVRSVWILYAASDEKIGKLSTTLSGESEQAAKNLPQIAEMMGDVSAKAPPQAYDALSRFKDNSWKALNSYAHAGIHPLRRHEEGYPRSSGSRGPSQRQRLSHRFWHAGCGPVGQAAIGQTSAGFRHSQHVMHASTAMTPNPSVEGTPIKQYLSPHTASRGAPHFKRWASL